MPKRKCLACSSQMLPGCSSLLTSRLSCVGLCRLRNWRYTERGEVFKEEGKVVVGEEMSRAFDEGLLFGVVVRVEEVDEALLEGIAEEGSVEAGVDGGMALGTLQVGVPALEGVDVGEDAQLAEGVAAVGQRMRQSQQPAAQSAPQRRRHLLRLGAVLTKPGGTRWSCMMDSRSFSTCISIIPTLTVKLSY
jgi:hypothetical protein